MDRDARLVADFLLHLRGKGKTTPMQVLKLVYLCHGWTLGYTGSPLIYEPVEAWQYGPVIPSLYHRYKPFGGKAISQIPPQPPKGLDEEEIDLITSVNNGYAKFSGLQLSDITHREGSPWHTVRVVWGARGGIIPNSLIAEYYQDIIESEENGE